MIQIPNWLKKIWRALQSIFSKIPSELQSAIHTGVVITENIKRLIDSPVADVLTAIIPGEIDDRIKIILRAAIPKILEELRLIDVISETSTPEEMTLNGIKTLGTLTKNSKNAFFHSLSVLLANIASDGRLTWDDGAYVIEWYYQKKFKAANK